MTSQLSRTSMAPEKPANASAFDLQVARRHDAATGIIGLDLVAPDGGELPPWRPGAHLEFLLPGPDGTELIRHYSLCGDPTDRGVYRFGVLEEPEGRGGSAYVHAHLNEGTSVRVRGPHNHFPLDEAAESYLFVAGGIGITPILAMARTAAASGRPWRVVYLVRSRDRLAFADELLALGEDRVTIWVDDEMGLFDLPALVAELTPGCGVYACGPGRMLDALTELHHADADWQLNLERFAAAPIDVTGDVDFEVVTARSGASYPVPAGCSILEVLRKNGMAVEFSCSEGVCGTCETAVFEGVPEHRDAVLSTEEREANDTMMICVSRARTARLVLDI
ncbi:PDR/VanB family oxidoreductase [Mycobacterium sp. NS-7484]|uniref:PDR/VanB family oxidoreductase n=1 Tax=Mycobacterium sp. NS-7484 TaxID=1834161 RepID=UPI0009F8D458|nr:PDR/VanB family oxidoreductase [Mycobacterium sp. NS-7484]